MSIYILVAGENKKTLEFVREATAQIDCHLVIASTMSLALFLAQKNKPALIISDSQLADADGTTFVQELKSDRELKVIPFIFLLGENSDTLLKDTLLKSGAQGVLSQATDGSELKQLLDKFR